MNWTQRKKSDPCPQSAVGHGVGLAGLAGLLLWIAVARHFGMDGPYAGMAGVFACGVPMVLWSMLVDKVHLRPSTGIDWKHPQPFRETLDLRPVQRSEELRVGKACVSTCSARRSP